MIDYLYLISSIVYAVVMLNLIKENKTRHTYIFIGLLLARLMMYEGNSKLTNIALLIMNISIVISFISSFINYIRNKKKE